MCYPIWLFSRKYGTVWYYPASSKLWYLTALSFVNFQEKLTGTSFVLCACEASFVRLAVWLALSALFASTTATRQWFPDIDHFYYLHKHLGHKLIQQPCTVLCGAFFLGIVLKRIHDSSLQYHKYKLESRSKMRDCFLACHGNLLLPGRVRSE
jgi:hypothetical protein